MVHDQKPEIFLFRNSRAQKRAKSDKSIIYRFVKRVQEPMRLRHPPIQVIQEDNRRKFERNNANEVERIAI
jgi:hypothetical protein